MDNRNRPRPTSMLSAPQSDWLARPPFPENAGGSSQLSIGSNQSGGGGASSASSNVIPGIDTVVASSSGLTLSIALAEPLLFLPGIDQTTDTSIALRGCFRLRVSKPAKIKTISLKFLGMAETQWPEGIPPKKVEYKSREEIISHHWPLFNAQSQSAEFGSGADLVQPFKGLTTTTTEIGTRERSVERKKSTFMNLSNRDQKRMTLQASPARGNPRGDCAGQGGPSIAQKGFRIFLPGEYIYNFQLPLSTRLPETVDVELGTVKYKLDVIVERAGAFRANLCGSTDVTLIRTLTEGSLEQTEPIAISRMWEDQLHYDIVISGKSFPLGSQIPIAFKLTPLAKVQCHKIKVFVTENIQYFTNDRKVHRLEPTRKLLLLEKRADSKSTSAYPGSQIRVTAGGGVAYDSRAAAARGDEDVPRNMSNLLGTLDAGGEVGPTEMEFSVQLPSCHQMKDFDHAHRLHFDTTYEGIQVHHWVKIVLRLSKKDAVEAKKRRHFEISIDSPLQILSCQAAQANVALPAYTSPESRELLTDHLSCGCPDAPRRPVTTAPPSVPLRIDTSASALRHTPASIAETLSQNATHATDTHPARPMHLIRQPSFLPPSFSASADDPPPPLLTPPPNYDSLVAGGVDGLGDYFQRLANDVSEEEDSRGTMSPGARIEVPLTPGGRINRSMDERRTWEPLMERGSS